jgi:uncharacterized protein YlxP (DUF503 family)
LPVLFCSLELYVPTSQSLKDKRRIIQSAAERLRAKFKCSVAELEHQELWQRSRLGVAVVSSDRALLDRIAERIHDESERLLPGELLEFDSEILEHA